MIEEARMRVWKRQEDRRKRFEALRLRFGSTSQYIREAEDGKPLEE